MIFEFDKLRGSYLIVESIRRQHNPHFYNLRIEYKLLYNLTL